MTWTIYQMRVEGEALPFYIGCTSRTSYRRWIEHKHRALSEGENSRRGERIREALTAGKEVLIEDLETRDTQDAAFEREMFWIAHYGRIPAGVLTNSDPGGYAEGRVISEEARNRMAEAKRGNTINVGRPRPDMVERFSKQVSAYTLEGIWVGTYSSAREAGHVLNIHFGSISDALKKKKRSAKTRDGVILQFKFGDSKEDIPPTTYRKRNV